MLGSLADTGLDVLASLITLYGVRIAAEPADRDHRFGHGKAEALAGLTDPEPGTGERWDAGQVWAHLAEFVGFWLAQASHVVERAAAARAAAMLSRACAGTIRKTMVFSLPGSEKAVRLAMTKLIVPELGHLVYEIAK